MKILITGIGITGKSTLRRLLVSKLRDLGLTVEHYDADRFRELREPTDIDCLKVLPDTLQENVMYIVEDVHGPLQSAALPLESYDLILYIKPDIFSHLMFWLQRIWAWFKIGRFSWEPEKGWLGTGKAYDFHNVVPILKTMLRDFRNRKKWISEDLKTISFSPHIIVHSQWTFKGIRFGVETAFSQKRDGAAFIICLIFVSFLFNIPKSPLLSLIECQTNFSSSLSLVSSK